MDNIEMNNSIYLSGEQQKINNALNIPDTLSFVDDLPFNLNQNLDDNMIFSCNTAGLAKESDSMDNISFHSAMTQLSVELQQFSMVNLKDSCEDIISTKPSWIKFDFGIDKNLEILKTSAPEMRKDHLEDLDENKIENPVNRTRDISTSTSGLIGDRQLINFRAIGNRSTQSKKKSKPHPSTVANLKERIKKIISEGSNGDVVKEGNELLDKLCTLLPKRTDPQLLQLNPPFLRQDTFAIDDPKREALPEIRSPLVSSSGAAYDSENVGPENPKLIQKIQEVFGNCTSVNVIPSTDANGPTIIIVMGTQTMLPVQQHIGDGFPTFRGSQSRLRPQSLSTSNQTDKFKLRRPSSPNVERKTPVKLSTPNLPNIKKPISTTNPQECLFTVKVYNSNKRSSMASGIGNSGMPQINESHENAIVNKLEIKTRQTFKETRGPKKITPTQSRFTPNMKTSKSSSYKLSPRVRTQRHLSPMHSPRSTNGSPILSRQRTIISKVKQVEKVCSIRT